MSPQFFFELSGESKDMPKAEVSGCVGAVADSFEIVSSGPGYVVASFDQSCFEEIADRMGFMFGIACTPVVDSCQCMAKLIQYCKVK